MQSLRSDIKRALPLVTVALIIGYAAWRNAPQTATAQSPAPLDVKLPLKPDSVRFALIGDMGTGLRPQYEVAQEMDRYQKAVKYDFVLMLGDNIYGTHTPADFKRKFEDPYKPLLGSGVQFFASLGNHDPADERLYKPFNMNGKRYYEFNRSNVRFLALDSNYMDPEQLAWIREQLSHGSGDWKIAFFHHPLYSDARYHGPDLDLRARLEPEFQKGGMDVVLAGHEHVYERVQPQRGINYFVLGNSGELRYHDLRRSPQVARGFDEDRAFGLFEISGDELYFQIISRTGVTVDSGIIARKKE